MNVIKKQSIGAWITLATIVITVIGLIIYGVALSAGNGVQTANGGELFYDTSLELYGSMTSTVTACGVIGLILLAGALVADQFRFEGIVKTVCDFVIGAARIIVPALLCVILLEFLYGSFTGLGWTFFSNEELEINPEAIKAGKTVVTALVFFGIAAVASIVAAFFGIAKKEQD